MQKAAAVADPVAPPLSQRARKAYDAFHRLCFPNFCFIFSQPNFFIPPPPLYPPSDKQIWIASLTPSAFRTNKRSSLTHSYSSPISSFHNHPQSEIQPTREPNYTSQTPKPALSKHHTTNTTTTPHSTLPPRTPLPHNLPESLHSTTNVVTTAYDSEKKQYNLTFKNPEATYVTGEKLMETYVKWANEYPIKSIEDPFNEDNFDEFAAITKALAGKAQIVGDDLTVTNVERVKMAIDKKACNSLLLKINQIGTISESIAASKLCMANGWSVMVSHRSGETEDTYIADMAVGLGTGQIKTGAPCRGERTAKLNQLLRIEEELAASSNEKKQYNLTFKNPEATYVTGEKLMETYVKWANEYPIKSIEDPFNEDNFDEFAAITKALAGKAQIVGDDLTVTNVERVKMAIDKKACNSLLLKINQIGTISESIAASKLCMANGWSVMVSHRSGETEDTYIADMAVGLGTGQIKTGAPCRGERTAKLNQLLRIEEELAASSNEKKQYNLTFKNPEATYVTGEKLMETYVKWANEYPIKSIEDPFNEDNFDEFAAITKALAGKAQIVGDDLTVTNVERVKMAIDKKACNSLLLKINQIGTISESIAASKLCMANGWSVMVSHRSGETEDTYIADMAVGLGTGQIKTGAPCRGERTAKLNQLLRIEEELAASSNEKKQYNLTFKNPEATYVTGEKLMETYVKWANEYPIKSIEDPFNEDNFDEFAAITKALAGKAQIVGDDLTVTNVERVKMAIDKKACNSLLLKINQIGTISESIAASKLCMANGWSVMVSHRSGETEDTYIADMAVGLGTGQIKTGAPCRGERTAKLNQLLRIEEELAASSNEKKQYNLTFKNPEATYVTGEKLMETYVKWANEYPIKSIEDPFNEDNFDEFAAITKALAGKAQIVGDDLTVTNVERVKMAIDKKACNSLLLKINQIGTISESIAASKLCMANGWSVMVSHRSGETEDTYIADMAVGLGTGQIKTGAPCRGERTAKLNQLLRIEEELAASSNEKKQYNLTFKNPEATYVTGEKLMETYVKWANEYPIKSIEDPFNEDNFDEFAAITKALAGKAQIVGDDLTVTNVERVKMAIDKKACNSLLLKINQIGTISESIAASKLCMANGWSR
eukprot:gene9008-6323_t